MAVAAKSFAFALLTATGASAATFGELSGAGPVGVNGMGPAPAYVAGPYANAPGYCPPNCMPAGYAPGFAGTGGAPANALPGAYGPMGLPGGAGMARHGGPEGVLPANPGASPDGPFVPALAANPRGYLPFRSYADGPNAPLMLWSFGQLNAGTDPFNPYGLSTPYMNVPWSTPMAGWTNSQTWNWWRERSGALPRNW